MINTRMYISTVDEPTLTIQVLTSTPTTAGNIGTPSRVLTSTRSDTPISTASGTPGSSSEPDAKTRKG